MIYSSPIPPSKDEHIEIYRRPNEDESKTGNTIFIFISNVLTISIAAVISIPLVFKVFEEFNLINEFDSIFSIDETITQAAPPLGEGGQSGYQLPPHSPTQSREDSASLPFWNSNHRRVRIAECNGMRLMGANFREYPSLNPNSIKGVVPADTWVTLTGANAYEDGLSWYEVVNESAIYSSARPDRKYLIGPEQIGWIEACFVES